MTSIREYNTTGLSLSERYELYNKVEPIAVGEKVWDAGDCWSYPEMITVTDKNQKEVTMFWNSIYFSSQKAANMRNAMSRAEYNDYQVRCLAGMA